VSAPLPPFGWVLVQLAAGVTAAALLLVDSGNSFGWYLGGVAVGIMLCRPRSS
jgi:hypothetical protein